MSDAPSPLYAEGDSALTFLDRSPVAISAFWHGDMLLLGGNAFRCAEKLGEGK